jgi:CubicO group peptidase (beta-lactamase class C family)
MPMQERVQMARALAEKHGRRLADVEDWLPLLRFTAADPPTPDQALETRIQGLIPDLERYIASGMKAFDVPGLAIGIVANGKLVYGKGFGVRTKGGGGTVDTRTVFQIGSTTKGFLATTLAMMVDRGRIK